MERNTIQEMKAVLDAIEQGKPVQFRRVDGSNEWENFVLKTPDFYKHCYRIKPEAKETLLTNRELAQWLAQGNGEVSIDGQFSVYTFRNYEKGSQEEPIPCNLIIRKWTDRVWHKPTREYAFVEEDA